MADDLGSQLQIQQQINKALQDRGAILAANEKSLQNQVQVAINLCKALKCEDLDQLEAGMKGVNEQMAQAAANAPAAGSAMEVMLLGAALEIGLSAALGPVLGSTLSAMLSRFTSETALETACAAALGTAPLVSQKRSTPPLDWL